MKDVVEEVKESFNNTKVRKKVDPKSFQGTAALIIGVLFVVLAGLIFATTTWYTLSDFNKVIMIFGFSLLFFGASWMAKRLFKIERTSQAFYILGSVFLFLTVFAVGYFRMLGDHFTLEDQHRFKVLCAGCFVMELALVSGMKQFKDKLYTWVCFGGMSVCIFYLLEAFGLEILDVIKGMVCYSFLMILVDDLRRRQKPLTEVGGEAVSVGAEFASFAQLHFWIFSVLMVLVAVAEGLLFIVLQFITQDVQASFFTTFTLGTIAAGLTLMVLRQKREVLQVLHSIAMIILFQFLGMCIPVELIYQVFIGILVSGLWFFSKRRQGSNLYCVSGDCIYTLAIVFNTLLMLLLVFFSGYLIGDFMAASVSVIILAAVVSFWSRRYPKVRPIIPVVLFALPILINGLLSRTEIFFLEFDTIVFVFLLALVIWDVVRRDRFLIAIMVIGSFLQLSFGMFLLSGYLFIKAYWSEGGRKAAYERGACVYLLAGAFLLIENWSDTFLFTMLCVTVVFAVEYIVFSRIRKGETRNLFWEVVGMYLLLVNLLEFYRNDSLSWTYMIACIVTFAIFYIVLYQNGRRWSCLLAAISILPMPLIALRYQVSENQLYSVTAAVLLITGFAARRYAPIICGGDDNRGEWKFDWFHILSIFVIIPMTMTAGAEWRFAYLLLTAIYVLQYTAVERVRRYALTMATVLAVLAFWLQPFYQFPELVSREIQLVPAALFIWYLGHLWSEKKIITQVQTFLYCLCLTTLIADALNGSKVVDALILEVICLLVFIQANVKKDMIWMRISGTIIVAVALYMTKEFWLSLSWWVYLLVAGLGLIAFAAVNEVKKK